MEYEFDVVKDAMKQDPWIIDLAKKSMSELTSDEIDKIVNDFIKKYWLQSVVFSIDVVNILILVRWFNTMSSDM